MNDELMVGLLAAVVSGFFAKWDVARRCGYAGRSSIECADKEIKKAGIVFIFLALVSFYYGSYLIFLMGLGMLLGAMHGKDEVERKSMEAEAKRRARKEGCSKLPALEAELKRVREEMKSLESAHHLKVGGQVADFLRSGQYAKLMEREAELEKEIREIKRRYNC
ncbi:hypothetical protein [Palaeococcus sp. (in: euryarchaeotes)]